MKGTLRYLVSNRCPRIVYADYDAVLVLSSHPATNQSHGIDRSVGERGAPPIDRFNCQLIQEQLTCRFVIFEQQDIRQHHGEVSAGARQTNALLDKWSKQIVDS